MKITSSYAVELLHIRDALKPTIEVYRQAVTYLIDVIDSEWPILAPLTALERINKTEHLVHSTKNASAKYDFDARFPKMPAYLRRAAMQMAMGAVSGYRSGMADWQESRSDDEISQAGQKPTLQAVRECMPVFYRPQMFEEDEEPSSARIKLLREGKWQWHTVSLRPTDVRYLEKHWSHCTPSAPILEKRHKKYFLRFTFTEDVTLPEQDRQPISACAVWLHGKKDAVCAIIQDDGRIGARRFIDFPERREALRRGCARIKRLKQNAIYSHFRYLRRLNDQYAIAISHEIVDFARDQGAQVIVTARIHAGKQQYEKAYDRLSYLRNTDVQQLTEHAGHRSGIRSARVDGENADVAHDGSDKAHNRDLDAAYNLGARFHANVRSKSLAVKEGSPPRANAPDRERSASCTLGTLRLSVKKRGQESPAAGSAQEQTRNSPGPADARAAENHKN